MNHKTIAGLRLFNDPQEQDAADLIGSACGNSVLLLQQSWGLQAPADCRVYVMTSWRRFLLQSSPWYWKVYLVLTWPLVARRARSIWPYAGGWALQFGRRRVVGVKPPRLIEAGNRSLGEQIFIHDRSTVEIVQTVTCHELTHAFTFHLKLPTWFHEGLATLSMGRFLGRPIVRTETLENLIPIASVTNGRIKERLQVDDPQRLISQYARGYWLTRALDETRPELLGELLARRLTQKELLQKVAAAFEKEPEHFWQEIDDELKSRFL